MTETIDYFDWLVSQIDDGYANDYSILLSRLFDTPFIWDIRNDKNREKDGINLRRHFVSEFGLPFVPDDICPVGPNKSSMLEMMVALAGRMEDILYDPDFGDQIPRWFWTMIENLGLNNMPNHLFDYAKFSEIMDIFVDKTYDKSGQNGNIFVTLDKKVDMRRLEIWYQMQEFIRSCHFFCL